MMKKAIDLRMKPRKNFEIGRILHPKSEIQNLRLDCAINRGYRHSEADVGGVSFKPSPGHWQCSSAGQFNLKFRISDLRCRIRPISDPFLRLLDPPGVLQKLLHNFIVIGFLFHACTRCGKVGERRFNEPFSGMDFVQDNCASLAF
jgi:hypothetical protein